jgi:hypothetical protein
MKTQEKKKGKASVPETSDRSKYAYYAILVLIIIFFGLIRLRLRDMPLERDEGEYAYAGQLILQGLPPYKLVYNMKLPGTYFVYALILGVFGPTVSAIHIGLLLVNAATIVVMYFIAARIAGRLAGVIAAATYGLLSASPVVLGFAGHATNFVILPALSGTLLLLKAVDEQRPRIFFWSGFLLGLGFIMKQPGIFFVIFAGLYLLYWGWKQRIEWKLVGRALAYFVAGAALPFALTCLILFAAGVFRPFWFWTVSYAWQYATGLPLGVGLRLLVRSVLYTVKPAVYIWIIVAIGFCALFWDRAIRPKTVFVIGFSVFSFLAVCPGFYFRGHYYILFLPAAALLAGIGVNSSTQWLRLRSPHMVAIPALLFLAACTAALVFQRQLLFDMTPQGTTRATYGVNPFPEAVVISKYLAANSAPDARIAILGSEPEIYFYTHRHSASGYIYMYPLMEDQKYAPTMLQEMIAEIEKSSPEFLLLVQVAPSWLAHAGNQQLDTLLTWADLYIRSHYELVGVADLVASDDTEYRWGEQAREYQAQSGNVVRVFRRTQ